MTRPQPGVRLLTSPLLLVSLCGAVLASACGRPAAAPGPTATGKPVVAPVAVKTAMVDTMKVPRTLTLSGSLTGAEEAQVAAGAAGKVLATYVERGSVVKKGALLARLDARAVSAQAAEALAQVESLKAQQAQAQLDCQRVEQMFQRGAISKADHDRQKTACATTKWSLSAAEARRSMTAQALQDAEIRAPFAGMVVERFVSPGEYVRPDSPVVTLVDVDHLRVELTVPESDVAHVRQGLQVDFQTSGSDKSVRGKVRYIGPAVRKQTRDAIVEAVVDNPDHDLRPGMFVTAELVLGDRTVPAVPEQAVRADGTLRHVYLVVGDRVEDRLVQTGAPLDGRVPVLGGLDPGAKVVAELTPDVRDGAKVR